jgi:hypothetical protein
MRLGFPLSGSSGRGSLIFILWADGMPKIGVFSHPIAVAADVHDMAVMHETINQGASHDVIA